MTTLLRLLPLLLLAASLTAQPLPRYALVVGNGDYPFASLGQTPASDAGAMRDALTLAGFQVDFFTNLDQTKLNNAVTAFGRKIKDTKGVALFYYSGHGVQHNNLNYLVPIGAELSDEEDIEGLCIPINRITAKMQNAGTSINLVVLDACRAFPLSRTGKTLTKGLSKETYAVPELLVAYATAPGTIATALGEGGLSLYTSQLLKHLKTPGLVLENVLKNTRRDVLAKSNNQQRPDETGNLSSDFYFFSATPLTGPADRDRDGTPDDLDGCPDEYGLKAANGCPDYDEDGVPNSMDKCPYQPGRRASEGCPDTDGDGTPDHQDRCPNQYGLKTANGCPANDPNLEGLTLPAFPWPPPSCNARCEVPKAALAGLKTLGEVEHKICLALDAQGYAQRSYFSVPNGFALVTQLEQYNGEDGSVRNDRTRWLDYPKKDNFAGVMDYLKSVVMPQKGHFRLFVFVATDHAFGGSAQRVSKEQATAWLGQGFNKLPGSLAATPLSASYDVTALVYEFVVPDTNRKPEQTCPSPLFDARTHLVKVGLAARLGL